MYSFQLTGLLLIAYLGLQINGLNLSKLNLEGFPENFQLHFFQKLGTGNREQGTVDKNSRKQYQKTTFERGLLLNLPFSNAFGQQPTNFQLTNLQPVNLQPVNLQPVNLQPVNLQPVNLQPVNLQPVNLQPVNLQPVNLQPANFQPTNLQPPNLQSANLQPTNLNPSRFLRPANLQPSPRPTCSVEVETLTSLLLKDLPSYANRVIQRARRSDSTVDNFSYVIVAGKPEFEPLPLKSFQSTTVPNPTDSEALQQIFLTTLERKYFKDKAVEFQNYHWLFLTKSSDGWRLVMIFSRIGSVSEGKLPTPPRESTNGVIGQAVKTWLRDCRAGTIRGFEQNPVNSRP
ncbi:pentapeptide repeat-containing protein [Moorena sp. SIO4E2]|uniref:pentapeptide repeat-containing protein n=1 Tax=Moorena sp. SIO4E2 TaxID=2607826 RepID=UPI00257CFC97|nr:pentapeptide repeat-containing protein [Moorena sp. SIO4E2]